MYQYVFLNNGGQCFTTERSVQSSIKIEDHFLENKQYKNVSIGMLHIHKLSHVYSNSVLYKRLPRKLKKIINVLMKRKGEDSPPSQVWSRDTICHPDDIFTSFNIFPCTSVWHEGRQFTRLLYIPKKETSVGERVAASSSLLARERRIERRANQQEREKNVTLKKTDGVMMCLFLCCWR